jgi:aspartyl-tRNA(Asn)/glutamyl-tRNA(Gln) amidotransferase subunit A
MAMADPALTSADEIALRIRNRELSAAETVDAVLSRITRYGASINAFALIDEEGARKAAQLADAKQAAGEQLGTLHGVPFSAKDLIDTTGLETAFGSWLMQGNIPQSDAECVRRLKAAGAILIGKTTTPEFAGSVLATSPRYGITRNPWSLDHSPGGSSGGAAAAVAAGFGPLALSTDGAGSARIPASCCGVLGLKPTLGRVPHERAPDLFSNFSHIGMQTRTTRDLSLMLNALSGPFAGDPWTIGRQIKPLDVPKKPVELLRGRKALFLPCIGNPKVACEVLDACENSLQLLGNAGLEIRPNEDDLDWGIETSRIIMRSAMSARMSRFGARDRARMDSSMRASIAEGEAIQAEAIKAAPLARTALFGQVEKLLGEADYILSPTLSAPPPLASMDATAQITIDGEETGNLRSAWFTYPTPFNLTGHPAISIPTGRTADGLPIGLHAVTRWDCEQMLIDLSAAMELLCPWGDNWPDLSLASEKIA